MGTATKSHPKQRGRSADGPYFVFHPSFEEAGAEAQYAPAGGDGADYAAGHMPDDVTRDWTRRMHHAAYRVSRARTAKEAARWRQAYYDCRDRIVMGNRKLVFRAVSRWAGAAPVAEDMAGECQIVLIQAVAAFNPWMGIRFSTYAFTCLMRALSRLTQRLSSDRLAHSLPLESLPDGEPRDGGARPEPNGSHLQRLDEYLQEGHTLLTPREKIILIRRFCLDDRGDEGTLEEVGRELGLSKERVRQVQMSALGKLRRALVGAAPAS